MQNECAAHIIFETPEKTVGFAATLAPLLGLGDVLLLDGPIGAGKSHFARALIQARLAVHGLQEDVPSPTFTLVQTYDDSKVDIWHADLYRLSNVAEIDELGLLDAFDAAICLVEWPDRLGKYAPQNALMISLAQTGEKGHRAARFSYTDKKWRAVLTQLGLHVHD